MRMIFLAPLCIAMSACSPSIADARFQFPSPPDELMKRPGPLKQLEIRGQKVSNIDVAPE